MPFADFYITFLKTVFLVQKLGFITGKFSLILCSSFFRKVTQLVLLNLLTIGIPFNVCKLMPLNELHAVRSSTAVVRSVNEFASLLRIN